MTRRTLFASFAAAAMALLASVSAAQDAIDSLISRDAFPVCEAAKRVVTADWLAYQNGGMQTPNHVGSPLLQPDRWASPPSCLLRMR